jgi:hypothetical protein
MKKSKQFVSIFLIGLALMLPSLGEEKSNKVTTALKGKLIELKGDKVTDGKISTNVDYYVLYHSASW